MKLLKTDNNFPHITNPTPPKTQTHIYTTEFLKHDKTFRSIVEASRLFFLCETESSFYIYTDTVLHADAEIQSSAGIIRNAINNIHFFPCRAAAILICRRIITSNSVLLGRFTL